MQTVLYGVEVWGGSISASTWNDIEKIQKAFLRRHLGVKPTTPYSVLLLETGRRPIEFHALIKVMQYLIEVQQMQPDRLPHKAWNASTKLQKNYKSKIICTGWATDIRKWFSRWKVEAYLTMPPAKVNMQDFQLSLLSTLQNHWLTSEKRVKLEYYQDNINPTCWSTYMSIETHAQPYISTPIPLLYRRNIARFHTRSHTFAIEKGAWMH